MDTNGHEGVKLLQGELVYSIVGAALEVLREVGHGLNFKRPKLEWERIVL